jgi:putative endonuclease
VEKTYSSLAQHLTVNQRVAGSSPAGRAEEVLTMLRPLFYYYDMYFLYILYSEENDVYYVGQSINPWNRVQQHNTNSSEKYTGKYKNWKLMAVFEISVSRSDAIIIERFIKKQKSRNLVLQLINPEFKPSGALAQLVRVPHVRD